MTTKAVSLMLTGPKLELVAELLSKASVPAAYARTFAALLDDVDQAHRDLAAIADQPG